MSLCPQGLRAAAKSWNTAAEPSLGTGETQALEFTQGSWGSSIPGSVPSIHPLLLGCFYLDL